MGFSVGDVIWGHVFALVTEFTWPWVPTQQAIFLAQILFGI